MQHHPDCDYLDRPPEGVVKPCNCGLDLLEKRLASETSRADKAELLQRVQAANCMKLHDDLSDALDRADKAEAACAELRSILETAVRQSKETMREYQDIGHSDGPCCSVGVLADAEHALSTTCGQGWASPETVAKWQKEREHCRQQADNWEARADKFQEQVKTLVEALELAENGQLSQMAARKALSAVKSKA